ncbi:MAG: DUF262 domain-containing protein [Anaerolineae bacterium]|nr:DUF262 domain-containing protein [Anaerolineae bacterium]
MKNPNNFCEVTTWTVSNLVDAAQDNPAGKYRIKIPRFQRTLVWTKEKQKLLITSLKRGFPIGSLLLFEDPEKYDGNKRNFQLIDGLQRTEALKRYVIQPTEFFSREDIPPDVVESIQNLLYPYSLDEERIISTIVNWVHARPGFTETDEWGTYSLTRALIDVLAPDGQDNYYKSVYFDVTNNNALKTKLAQLLQEIRESSDISRAQLAIIIYSGPIADLPTVFELLNSQGTALSRYEIYASKWMGTSLTIANRAIRDAIWEKYDRMADEGYSLDVVEESPDEKSRQMHKYTLFEYLFGFGQLLCKDFPQLFRSVTEDQPSSAGFNLFSACVGLNVREMERLPDILKLDDIPSLEAAILESAKFVRDVFSSIFSVKPSRGRTSIYHTEYQIISMIATAFGVRYNYKDPQKELDNWRIQRKTLEQNLPMFYLSDILKDYWKGTGDNKLHDTVTKSRYLGAPPSVSNWTQVLESWFFDNQMLLQHNRRLVRDATPEVLLLKYIYVHKFTVAENSKKYHVEHVIPVDQLQRVISENERWPINSIANLALLNAEDNQRKGNKTFKEHWDSLFAAGQIDDVVYQTEIEAMSNQLICPINILPKGNKLTKDGFADFLKARFYELRSAFLTEWADRIPNG